MPRHPCGAKEDKAGFFYLAIYYVSLKVLQLRAIFFQGNLTC
jgi:hypothetical protein